MSHSERKFGQQQNSRGGNVPYPSVNKSKINMVVDQYFDDQYDESKGEFKKLPGKNGTFSQSPNKDILNEQEDSNINILDD